MEFILDLVNDGLPSQVLCILVLLIIVLKDFKLSQNFKVCILYIASFVMILMGWIEIYLGIIILLLAEFSLLEIFTEDSEKRSLFNWWYKIIDCIYRLIAEYYFIVYLGAVSTLVIGELVVRSCNNSSAQNDVLCWICGWQSTFATWVVLAASALILAAVLCITRMKFETKMVTDIMKELKNVSIYSVPIKAMETKFNMLVAFEDKTFFDRNEDSHTVLSPCIMKGAFKYINSNTLRKPFKTMRKLFSRGYGTIEM